jgi:hypothetical protein
MAGGKSPVPREKREAILRMRKGGATFDQIAAALGVSKAFISTFIKKRDLEDQAIRAAAAVPPGAPASPAPLRLVPSPTVVAGATSSPGTSSSGEADPSAGAEDIAKLEGELAALYELAENQQDPVERVRISTAISSITARLQILRREEAKARPNPDNDDNVKRAGYAAADKLRRLLEEALGEKLAAEGADDL